MLRSSLTLLTALQFLAHAVSANPVVIRNSPVTLPLSRRLNLTSVHNLLRHDQARARGLRARSKLNIDAVINEPVDNQAITYIASVGVGSPAVTCTYIGISNTWVGAGRTYVRTSTAFKQPTRWSSVTYGSGSFSGTEFTDTVTIAPGLVIPDQSIGVASTSVGFDGTDGILGIGPVDLTTGTLSPANGTEVPTVTDTSFSRKLITANEIGISFEPTTTRNNERRTHLGPRTTAFPASEFWGVDQSIKYGTLTIQPLSAVSSIQIPSAGTTLVLIASDAFVRYRTATGAVLDPVTGLLQITSAQFANLQTLSFVMPAKTLELTPNAQLWPRALNTAIGGVAGNIYLIIGDLGTPSGEGFDFVNGFALLERFYTVFNSTNREVGFATTSFTTSTVN
ncbi:aspartic protease [Infundibulicybe gibba]|nr:aspartic protease [Infundibulicybe gibba]